MLSCSRRFDATARSLVPTSIAMAYSLFRFAAWLSSMAREVFAVQREAISDLTLPSLTGRSRKSGGLFALGDQAAARANARLGPDPAGWASAARATSSA